ncbi:MBOAT family protein [Paraconexibacter antarcticus]|uniref:MBOAT family protein n=1 Tax=Paraconexibacter antarcticus TaxID=2949664 RepID=A0ABY5DTQ1_9ACTN|nr:MBOAT family protein [Paraconexibacter antarcticus]UTI64050.1 MBOAT family protein [Paraconexibacter antarcticus]
MLFPTVQFAIFFPVVLTLSWALMSRPRYWKPFIVLASYVFYAAANPRFCLLLGGVTLVNQGFAKLIARTDDERRRKQLIVSVVTIDLAALGVFKYYSFFVSSLSDTLDKIGLGSPLPLLTIALPVGISFFTFQAISYVVDVYRRQVEPSPTLDVALYLSFFPHLVAGPIVRAKEFLPQLLKPRDPSRVAVGAGISLIALGLVKKVVIADYLARSVVDPVFGVPQQFHAPDVLLAAYAYTAQIYCDFSGYTDMAIGLALLMGYVFPQNFNSPYKATGFQDFWRRWHMTLSRFLRDFLYIPLGGNRGGKWFVYRNLMLTMLLGGLWHGAAWTFVIWGGLHGLYQVLERMWGGRVKLPVFVRWFVTFHGVVLGWIVFRAQDIGQLGDFLKRLADPGALTLLTPGVALAVGLTIGLQLVPTGFLQRATIWFEGLRPVALGAGLAVLVVVATATISSQGVAPFIYFRF